MIDSRNIIMILLSTGVLLFISGSIETYGQPTNNNTLSKLIFCFVDPCPEQSEMAAIAPLSNTSQNTATALIGFSFNNISLQDIQENKEKIKYTIGDYINKTIEKLASGKATTYTYALTNEDLGLGCTPDSCIIGIILPDDLEKP